MLSIAVLALCQLALVSTHTTNAFGPTDAKCVKDEHGPACKTNADCLKVPSCLRCALSGFCTETPAPGPPSPHPPGPSPAPPPGPNGASGTAGDYDLIMFARFWMGEPASEIKCGSYQATGLTLHGIWPQYTAARDGSHFWPQFCNSTHDQVLPGVVSAFMPKWKQYAPAYPGTAPGLKYSDLAAHEWQKHGTCWSAAINTVGSNTAALTALESSFFQASLDLNQKYPTPQLLVDAQASGKQVSVAALQNALGGPTRVALSCKGSTLAMVSMCLSKDMSTQIDCPPSTLQSSYDNGCIVNKVTQLNVAFNCTK